MVNLAAFSCSNTQMWLYAMLQCAVVVCA